MRTHGLVSYLNGTTSLKRLDSGEVMHSSIGPWQEAMQLYALQSRIVERLGVTSERPLVIYDVGLGIAANVLATLECALSMPALARPLSIYSFENDISGLRTALDLRTNFPFFAGHEDRLTTLLEERRWNSNDGRIRWTLLEGDFFAHLAATPPAEVVFYDFYAPKSCPDLWTVARFKKLREALIRSEATTAADLYTYSASTRVRVALLLAGFYVGYGRTTEMKSDTTVASTELSRIKKPLGADWLAKLDRSGSKMPYGFESLGLSESEVLSAARGCPQFH